LTFGTIKGGTIFLAGGGGTGFTGGLTLGLIGTT